MAIAPHWLSDNPWRTLCLACALAATGALPAPAQSASEVVLHSFSPNPYKGEYPQAGVIRDAAGNLYGTTSAGGPMGAGVVYKVDTAGNYSVLYAFTGGADGSVPAAGVVRDPAGNLYGTTLRGGGPNFGVIFKVDPAGQETVLYTFPNGGGSPSSGVILDSAGNLYGTASTGDGSVYKLDPAGKFTVLYGFTGGAGGNSPSGVILDPAGNLYGAAFGGTANWGVVYMLDASKRYKETVLHTFTGGTDGSYPNGLIRDSSGNLYGTTASGGIAGTGAGYGAGVVYKLDAAGEQTVLYSFTGGADGCYPGSPVALDAAGNLYGTTGGGGAAAGLAGWGVVFEVDTAGQETVLHTFSGGTDGGIPEAGVILTAAGNFYGTTYQGGAQGVGTVYKLNGDGKETVLYSFSAAADGGNPMSGPIRDAAGNFYGTTYFGGAANYGGVYKLDTKGNETLLYSFTGEADGGFPAAGVALDSAGNLYGTTSHGGAAGYGVVFKLNTAGQETVLYSFTGGADGGGPQAGVIRDSEGNLYGTTVSGGETGICIPSGCGVVYQVDTAGNETVLYSFADGADGGFPYAGLIRDAAGNLFGTASGGGIENVVGGSGVVFKLDPAGHETVLHSFAAGADGSNPVAGVVADPAGNLYGTTKYGGTPGYGVVYEVDAAGKETVLYAFTGELDGAYPYGGVIRDSAGNLYGTTYLYGKLQGGVTGAGVVFKLDTELTETALYHFTGGADGGGPEAGVIRDAAGNLYGTTYAGGENGAGVVFKIEPR